MEFFYSRIYIMTQKSYFSESYDFKKKIHYEISNAVGNGTLVRIL